MDRLHVATLNILNLADRWDERLPLLLADMAALQPDLLGLQEVVYPMQQDRLIGAAGEGRYAAVRGWAGRPEYGNSLLVREPLAAVRRRARSTSGWNRSAHRVMVDAARRRGGRSSRSRTSTTSCRTTAVRDEQAAALLDWLDGAPATDAHDRRGRLQRRSRRAGLRPDARRRLPVRVRGGERRGAGRHLAVAACRRRRWTPTATRAASTTSGSAARSAW